MRPEMRLWGGTKRNATFARSNRLFSITSQPGPFVKGKRVMGILCRSVLRGAIVRCSDEPTFIGPSRVPSCSRVIPVIRGTKINGHGVVSRFRWYTPLPRLEILNFLI